MRIETLKEYSTIAHKSLRYFGSTPKELKQDPLDLDREDEDGEPVRTQVSCRCSAAAAQLRRQLLSCRSGGSEEGRGQRSGGQLVRSAAGQEGSWSGG